MRQFFAIFLWFCALCGILCSALNNAQAARRPGIMRPVPLAVLADSPNASAVRGAWCLDPQSKKVGLIFTREANGTRNLWKATAGQDSDWPIEPLTNFAAPLWADQAQVSADGRTIICVSNAFGDDKTSQIARFNEKTGLLEALTRDAVSSHSPSLSPDGKSLVFVRDVGGISTIFLLSLNEKIATFVARRVTEGRHPAWLDNGTLLFSDARKKGLYRLSLPADWSPLQIIKTKAQGLSLQGGEVSVVPDSSQLCIAPHDDRNGEQNGPQNGERNSELAPLFFMAPNGSGERALRNTDGARAPRFAPDGTALLFDAPLAPNGPRTLWVMNLAPIVPTVEITRVTMEKAALNIIGTVFCEDSPEVVVKLEAGQSGAQGGAPEKWQTIALPKAPLQKESLAQWLLPDGIAGEWTLRLTATSPDGDAAQTSMTLALPLRAGSTVTNASSDVSIFVSPVSGAAGIIGTHGIGSQVIPGEWINGKFVPRGPKNFPEKQHTTVPNAGLSNPALANATPFNPNSLAGSQPTREPSTVPPAALPLPPFTPPVETRVPPKNDLFGGPLRNLPLPALPPAPSPKNAPLVNTPPMAPKTAPPIAPSVLPVIPSPSVLPLEKATVGPLNLASPPVRHHEAPGMISKTLGGPKEKLPSKPVTTPATKTVVETRPGDGGQINLDVPDDLKSGSDSDVTCLLRNTGQSVWNSSGSNPVRLLVRWFDGETGQRFRWEIKWLPGDIKPGGSLPLSFTLTPPRAGKLRLNLTVVRLPNGKYQPASTSDKDDLDKLAEKNFRVTVE